MFDPISGPSNEFQGPSVGHSTENGDNWHTAVRKINAGFEKIIEYIKHVPGDIVEAIDGEARKRIEELEDTVTDLQRKYDDLLKLANTAPMVADMGTDAEMVAKINAAANVAPTIIGDPEPPSFTHTDASEGGTIASGTSTATEPAV